MNRRQRTRSRQKQINILHTTTRKRHSQKQVTQAAVWGALVLGMIVVVGVGLHLGLALVLDKVLYTNPRYDLAKIEIQPRGHFTERQICQAAGLKMGQNLWTLNLSQITNDLEKINNVSSAKIERHFPDKVAILITERVPVVKIVGLNDLGIRETFYLDRDGFALKPREDETPTPLPEIIGLSAELEPGMKLDQSSLACALQILDAIDHTKLHTSIDIRTIGLVVGIELQSMPDKPGARAFEAFLRAYNKNVLIRTTGDIIALSPPLIISKAEIDQLFDILRGVLKTLN